MAWDSSSCVTHWRRYVRKQCSAPEFRQVDFREVVISSSLLLRSSPSTNIDRPYIIEPVRPQRGFETNLPKARFQAAESIG